MNDLLNMGHPNIYYEGKLFTSEVSHVPGNAGPIKPIEKNTMKSKDENECGPRSKFDA